MKHLLYFIPAALMFLTSCASTKSAYSIAGEWQVTNLKGKAITPKDDVTPMIGFDINNGSVYGFTGCNRLTGSVDVKRLTSGRTDFSRMGITRMLCQDDQYETEFLDALNNAQTLETKGNEMVMKDRRGNVIITLKKK